MIASLHEALNLEHQRQIETDKCQRTKDIEKLKIHTGKWYVVHVGLEKEHLIKACGVEGKRHTKLAIAQCLCKPNSQTKHDLEDNDKLEGPLVERVLPLAVPPHMPGVAAPTHPAISQKQHTSKQDEQRQQHSQCS